MDQGGSGQRILVWGVVALLVALLALAWSDGGTAPLIPPPAPPASAIIPAPAAAAAPAGIQIWQWSGAKALSADEERDLAALPTDAIMQWIGSVDLAADGPRFAARGGRVRGLDAAPRWSVIRIEVRCAPLLGTPAVDRLADVVVQRLPTGSAGLQLDFDVPVRLLPAYGAFLAMVRERLPPHAGLSCTGLLSWLSSPDLAATLAPVDWWVPQCYSTSVPKNPATAVRLAGGGDMVRTAARCEALAKPYRIGLPTFEQATWWNPDGSLRSAAVALPVEDLLAAGLVPITQASDEERLLRFVAPADTTVVATRLQAGSTVLTGQPTVAGLAARMASARTATGTWFRGFALFRLPGDGDLPALSTDQLRAAVRGMPSTTGLLWSWTGVPGNWTLTIANRGTIDLSPPAEPLRLEVHGACDAPLDGVPGGVRYAPALDGVPVAPGHADGLLVTVPFLRAGRTMTLPPLAISSAEAPAIDLRSPP